MPDRKIHWRCFHCGDTFTKAQVKHARDHFGSTERETPVCLIREPGEHAVLRALRKANEELEQSRAEDNDVWRSLYSMAADHAIALRREEERGYAKGLADGRRHVTDNMVSVAMPWLMHWQHMRPGDRRGALRNALEAALSSQTPAASEGSRDAINPILPQQNGGGA